MLVADGMIFTSVGGSGWKGVFVALGSKVLVEVGFTALGNFDKLHPLARITKTIRTAMIFIFLFKGLRSFRGSFEI